MVDLFRLISRDQPINYQEYADFSMHEKCSGKCFCLQKKVLILRFGCTNVGFIPPHLLIEYLMEGGTLKFYDSQNQLPIKSRPHRKLIQWED